MSLLGPLEASVLGQPMPVGGLGRRALLAALAVNLDTVVGVNRLVEVIWDDQPPMTATTKLQGHISALRQSLVRLGGPDAVHILQTRPPGYVLCARLASTDLARFDELTRRGAAARLPDGAEDRVAALSAALRLWRGDACVDARAPGVAVLAASLDERRWRAMEDLAEAQLVLGDHNAVIDAMEPLVRRWPYRERAWEHLIEAHMRRGDVASALAAHDQLCEILAGDLGVTPGRRIGRLVSIIRAGNQH
ncbi:AfsR/SARP family transcriptional regulator [Micromonospora sp. DH14]|uniref:AfsR/SARP family transcriptional regulator n=1 Tax=Micromonospora sp. DH14 TaxID=3040120 RepID=UPI0024424B9C|nr:AfsR/SARP family transcriptional regulator [Micromonospora sp. DH14]MDG9675307.1 AfsR/SARP family transcriptional regulator [Micromonospora sp. DH14]